MRVFFALALVGCGVTAPEDCPARPSHLDAPTMQCVENGCGIADLKWSALACTQLGPWQRSPDCSFRAAFRCANERTAVVRYDDTSATFEVRGPDCLSSYVLSTESVCE